MVDNIKIDTPTIQIVKRPNPITMKNSDIVVVTENNLQEVIERIKNTQV